MNSDTHKARQNESNEMDIAQFASLQLIKNRIRTLKYDPSNLTNIYFVLF